jgi:hypothetical protein
MNREMVSKMIYIPSFLQCEMGNNMNKSYKRLTLSILVHLFFLENTFQYISHLNLNELFVKVNQ